MKPKFGIDIGNVIINFRLTNSQSEENYSNIPATDNSFNTIKKLSVLFEGRIFLISKCKELNENKILSWLKNNDFYNKTNVNEKNLLFCKERNEKAAICKTLKITHFIDDRIEVLSHMISIVPNLFLYKPEPTQIIGYEKFLTAVIKINNWKDVIGFLK